MVRTQIQLTEDQFRSLKKLAIAKGCSLNELVRRGVEILLRDLAVSPKEIRDRAASVSGKYRSGLKDLSKNYNRYLAEVYKR